MEKYPDISGQDMRAALFEALTHNGQLPQLHRAVAERLAVRGLIPAAQYGSPEMPSSLWALYHDTLASFFAEEMIAPGSNSDNGGFPWVSLTTYGREAAKSNAALPHDPENFLRGLEAQMQVDDIERRFLGQALDAYRKNIPDASRVMLGCAAEHLVLKLAESIVVHDPNASTILRRLQGGPAKKVLDAVRKWLDPGVNNITLPGHLKDTMDTRFLGIAETIRVARNDSGHPALAGQTNREDCYQLLRIYRTYREWVAEMIAELT